MASKASLRAYCVLGCTLWFAREIWEKHGQDDYQLANDAIDLKQAAKRAVDKWEDQVTRRQAERIHTGIKRVFDGQEDALRVSSMLLAALEDIYQFVKAEKKTAIGVVIQKLAHIVQKYYDTEGDEWSIYEDAVAALDRFNQMIGEL